MARRHGALGTALVLAGILNWAGAATPSRAEDEAPADVDPMVTSDLLRVMTGEDEKARHDAEEFLVARGADVLPDLVAALGEKDVRVPAMEVLRELGPDAAPAVPGLMKILKIRDSTLRRPAVRALHAIGAAALPAAKRLSQLTAVTDGAECLEAAVAWQAIVLDAARASPCEIRRAPVHDAIDAGCGWLVAHQTKQGSWRPEAFNTFCPEICPGRGKAEFTVGVTGLALTALLRDPTPEEGEAAEKRSDAIRRGLAWLIARQDEQGMIGAGTSERAVYNHGAAMLALATAAANGYDDVRPAAERAAAHAMGWQNPYLAWRYAFRNGDNDTSVTAWMVMALEASFQAGVGPSPGNWRASLWGASAWVHRMTDPEDGRVGYRSRGGGRLAPGQPRQWEWEPEPKVAGYPRTHADSMTAAGAFVLVVAQRAGAGLRGDETLGLGTRTALQRARLDKARPDWSKEAGGNDFCYWLHGSAFAERAGGVFYEGWRRALFDTLLPNQIPAKPDVSQLHAAGSWPASGAWARVGGRIYTTAVALLALEACAAGPKDRPDRPSTVRSGLGDLKRAAKKAERGEDADLAAALELIVDSVGSAYSK